MEPQYIVALLSLLALGTFCVALEWWCTRHVDGQVLEAQEETVKTSGDPGMCIPSVVIPRYLVRVRAEDGDLTVEAPEDTWRECRPGRRVRIAIGFLRPSRVVEFLKA